MTSTSSPPTLRPRCSSASSTESFMCLPMMPAGPESEVMNPILTGSAARATWPASSPATRPRTALSLSARTLTSLGWRGILACHRDDVVAAARRGPVRVHGGLEPAARLDQRAQHHGEVTSAHLGLGGLRVFRQPRPRLVVVAVGEQPREAMIELLFRRARPLLGPAHELVRHAAAGHERRAPSTTVGNVAIRWQELITMTSGASVATCRPCATRPSRTAWKFGCASVPANAAS